MRDCYIADSADVSSDAFVGTGSKVWHLAQIRERARIGEDCVVGRGAYVGLGVSVGDRCKIQNYALIYTPARLEDGVFVGPGAILTNDRFPRAINPDGSSKAVDDWTPHGVHVGAGATIGSMATVLAGVAIGEWSTVGAGAVVTATVPPFALVVGNPARRIGWVGRSGRRLEAIDEILADPGTGDRFRETNGQLERLA